MKVLARECLFRDVKLYNVMFLLDYSSTVTVRLWMKWRHSFSHHRLPSDSTFIQPATQHFICWPITAVQLLTVRDLQLLNCFACSLEHLYLLYNCSIQCQTVSATGLGLWLLKTTHSGPIFCPKSHQNTPFGDSKNNKKTFCTTVDSPALNLPPHFEVVEGINVLHLKVLYTANKIKSYTYCSVTYLRFLS